MGFFENDDAMDWLVELEETGLDAIQSALMIADEDDIEVADASRAVAAAVVVLAMSGSTFKEIPEEVEAWLEEHDRRPEAMLIERAQSAMRSVRDRSDLRDLWEESDDFGSWDRLMRVLIKKLDARVR